MQCVHPDSKPYLGKRSGTRSVNHPTPPCSPCVWCSRSDEDDSCIVIRKALSVWRAQTWLIWSFFGLSETHQMTLMK